MPDFDNTQSAQRTVLDTGAAIGIGRATALAFARAGDHLVVTDVLSDEGEATVKEIRSAGGSADFAPLDVRSTEQATAVVRNIEAAGGSIDVIVANAGIRTARATGKT